ncbi:MAG: SDR family oxidoreductase, partial [Candidatus Auribacterota bacterium]|nr:SDR family oxidoreductase [Candidatus Auribacterota bacterium]
SPFPIYAMKVLVTGGAGFIGSHIVHALVANGDRVWVIDDYSTGKSANLADISSRITMVEGDIRDPDAVGPIIDQVDAVLHQGALPSVPRSFADPVGTTSVNAGGTLNLLESVRRSDIRVFVLASSSSIYGDIKTPAKSEDLPPHPLSPYAVSKLAGEYYCKLYHKLYKVSAIALRYFNVFGPGQDPASQYAAVIPKFSTAIIDGRPPIVHGDGRQSRDFTYIDNVVQANLKCLAAPPGAAGEVFNVACGEQTDLLTTLEILGEISGKNISPVFEPARPGDVRHSLADIGKARKILGYSPGVLYPEGLRRTFQYFKEKS